jgi:hypothetical protein
MATSHTEIRFFHPDGQRNVEDEMHAILDHGTSKLRIASCFFTRAGRDFMEPHVARLATEGNYLIVSAAGCTDIDALAELHALAPRSVFIHLGGKTPQERAADRALMHSKVLAASDGTTSRFWIGSHNLTGAAICGGNFEAATALHLEDSSDVARDVYAHLEACRKRAELFDPSRIPLYRCLIDPRDCGEPPGYWEDCLVIRAIAPDDPPVDDFAAELRQGKTGLEDLVRLSAPVLLALHDPPSDPSRLVGPMRSAFQGQFTSIGRTEVHPVRGLRAAYSEKDATIDFGRRSGVGAFTWGSAGDAAFEVTSQSVVRIQSRDADAKTDLFSVGSAPVRTLKEKVLDDSVLLDDLRPKMARHFTDESVQMGRLVYSPLRDVLTSLEVRAFEFDDRKQGIAVEGNPQAGQRVLRLRYALPSEGDLDHPYLHRARRLRRSEQV